MSKQSSRTSLVVYRQSLLAKLIVIDHTPIDFVLLKLKDASQGYQAKDMVFMTVTWSHCAAG